MVASVTVKTNSVQLSKQFRNIQKKFPNAIKKALANVSAFQIANIKDRTQKKGISVNGSSFRPYSKEYKRRLVKQSGVVDLTDTGQMFSSLTSKITPSKGTLFFRQAQANKKAFYHDVVGAGKGKVVRPFFSINDRESDKIGQLFADKIFKDIGL
jgi:hypothetical protein